MYTMKEVCDRIDMTYETLKYYCNMGLVPNVKRDKNNHRQFSENDVLWLEGLKCLRKCGFGIKEMQEYMNRCLQGADSIPERKVMLDEKRELLNEQLKEIVESLNYIDEKQKYYDAVMAGDIEYSSNLIEN